MDVLAKIRERNEQDKLNRRVVKALLPERKEDAHKGDFGRVLLVCGSEGMMGAAILAARSALRTGSGLVQLAIPRELFPIAQVGVVEATCLDRTELGKSIDMNSYDAIMLGSGLGKSEDARAAVKLVLSDYEGPLVIDADGLNIIAEEGLQPALKERSKVKEYPTVITPHMGEAKRLLSGAHESGRMADQPADQTAGFTPAQLAQMSRKEIAEALMALTGATVLLKGHDTYIVRELEFGQDIINEIITNTTGNPGMATAGSGDVLTGIIGSLLGQGLTAFDAARAGAYIHGLAGDIAAVEFGEASVIASDMVNNIGKAIIDIQETK